MINQQFGILTLSLCAVGYFISWRYLKIGNYKIAILLLVVCGLALRVFTSFDFFLHTWDERYHALVAKNLIQHPLLPTLYDNPILPYDYKSWANNHVWLHKQPLPLWIMATSLRLFGVNEIALRLPSILLTTIGIGLIFAIGKFYYNKNVAYLAAFLFSINGLIIEMTGGRCATDHIDIFFLFFVELAVFWSIQYVQKVKTIYNILVGLSIGAAILTKWLPALIVLPIWFLLLIDSGKFKPKLILIQFLILLITCIAVFGPWQLYIFKTFPMEAIWEASFNFKHITETLGGQTGSYFFYIDKIRINYGELIYLPLLWFIKETVLNSKDLKRLSVLIWFLIPFLFFSFVKTKMQAYILFACPALFLMTSEFWFKIWDFKNKHKLKWFFNLILILLIALPIRYMIERVKPFEKINRNPQWVVDLKKLNDRKIKNGVLFNYDNPIEAMFYTNLIVYPNIPEEKIIRDLIKRGNSVFIKEKYNIPENIRAIEGVFLEP